MNTDYINLEETLRPIWKLVSFKGIYLESNRIKL